MDEDHDESPAGGDDAADKPREFLPPLEFSSLVFPFYSQALVKLGVLEDPIHGGSAENIEFAKRLIDLMDLLKTRTDGRLEPEEAAFIEAALSELKMRYMQKAEILKV
ncbi:MAG: DUF1844 domain-containing protein [Acidobacteriota bacterium]|nr:DUF1844 domain-containing protein [Acidobacteriota bacterium]